MNESGSTLAGLGYTRDDDDLITGQSQGGTPGLPGPSSTSETYTDNEQLEADGSLDYSYDPAGNLTDLDGDETLDYSSTTGDLTSSTIGTTTTDYTYDQLGERTAATSGGTGTTYTYDQAENMTQAATPTTTVDYVYNGDGQLMNSAVGSTTTDFTWDDTGSTPELLTAGSENYVYGPTGVVEQISNSGSVQYLHTDDIGSVRLITSGNSSNPGSVVASCSYDPYGAPVSGSDCASTSAIGYAGEYTDPTTGLTYNQARWYDPATGQFMVVDPKVQSTWQPYSYANDNPLSLTDPTGDCSFPVGCAKDVAKAVKKVVTKVAKSKVAQDVAVGVVVGVVAAVAPEAIPALAEGVDDELTAQAVENIGSNVGGQLGDAAGQFGGGVIRAGGLGAVSAGAKSTIIDALQDLGITPKLNISQMLARVFGP